MLQGEKVKAQSKGRLAQLSDQFPSISQSRSHFMWRPTADAKLRYPQTHVAVQKPDCDLMFQTLRGIGGRGYMWRQGSDLRGERTEFCFIYDERGEPLGNALASYGPDALFTPVKNVFDQKGIDPAKIAYLTIETAIKWHKPKEPDDGGDTYLPGIVEMELDIIVYPRPKHITWQELIDQATTEKEERDNAYKFPPKVTPDLPWVQSALVSGLKLHGFLSGGGLRVFSLDNEKGEEKAYAEHPHAEDALIQLNEDYMAGGLPYNEAYGPKGKYTHYLTGSPQPTSNIDSWLRQGYTIDAWCDGCWIVVTLKGWKHVEMPAFLKTVAEKMPGHKIGWTERGFKYEGYYSPHLFANGQGGHAWQCLNPDKKGCRETMYRVAQTGRGADLWKALQAALDDAGVEIPED